MKNRRWIGLLLVPMLLVLGRARAQSCGGAYLFRKGAVVETSLFDKKGKPNGKTRAQVQDVESNPTGQTARFLSTTLSQSGKIQAESQCSARCEGGQLRLDLRNFVSPDQMKAFRDMEIHSKEGFMDYPATLTVGSTLADGILDLEVVNQGTPFGNLEISMTSRKVEAKEDVVSEAGTFSAFKIRYKSMIRTRIMGMGIPIEMEVVEWYSPGFGVVKTETYSRSGSLLGSSLVTSVK